MAGIYGMKGAAARLSLSMLASWLVGSATAETTDAPLAQGRECVNLLHGMVRSAGSMRRMAVAVESAGYVAANIDYPSRRQPIEELALDAVNRGLARCAKRGTSRVHFVTHSLGGILVRYYLSRQSIPGLGRVVMLSPPNRGSEAADRLKHLGWYQWLNGPAGQQLGTGPSGLAERLGPVVYPVGVITGNRSALFDFWLSNIIPGEDDGKVSVERAKVEGMRDFLVVPYSHPFIMDADEVISQTLYFLRRGCFRRPAAWPETECRENGGR